jgi:hypothetical protein
MSGLDWRLILPWCGTTSVSVNREGLGTDRFLNDPSGIRRDNSRLQNFSELSELEMNAMPQNRHHFACSIQNYGIVIL